MGTLVSQGFETYIAPGPITTTYKEMLDAIVKNGFNHIRDQWIETEDTWNDDEATYTHLVVGACVLGQGSINIGSNTSSFQDALDNINVPYNKIPKALRDDYDEDYPTELGNLLITMNDYMNADGEYIFSWKQLVKFATTHITPHFDEKVNLQPREYKIEKVK